MPSIDIHAHLTPRCLIDSLTRGTTLHGIDPRPIARGQLRSISVDERITDMDRYGIDVQVVSTEPQMYGYQFDVATTSKINRECNDEVAELVRDRPQRLAGLAIVPMQDVSAAVDEMTRATTELGLCGVMIGDHVNGRLYDEPEFAPFWRAAEELGALVLMHQASPTLVAGRTTRYHLPNTVGNAVDRTINVASLIFGGVLDDFPTLKICLSHAGGYTCFAAGRLDWGWQWRKSVRQHVARRPSSYLSQFYYDCITHDERALRFVIDTVGIDRVVFGSDYPGFAAGSEGSDYDPRAWLMNLPSLTDAEKHAVLHDNPTKLLDARPARSS